MLTILFLCLVAFTAGVVDSIAGGGGLLKLPAVLLTGITPQQAMGVNKFAGTLGTTAAMLNFARKGLVPWNLTILGVPGALLGSAAGGQCIMALDAATAGRILVILLPIAALVTLIPWKSRPARDVFTSHEIYGVIPLICFGVGFYDGFFGPGAGSFYIIALHFCMRMTLITASALTKVINLASNVGALVVFLLNGQVLFMYALPMAVADILGNIVGSQLAMRKGAKIVKIFLVISISILFVTLVIKYF